MKFNAFSIADLNIEKKNTEKILSGDMDMENIEKKQIKKKKKFNFDKLFPAPEIENNPFITGKWL